MTTVTLPALRLPRLSRVVLVAAAFAIGLVAQLSGFLAGILSYRDDILYLSRQHIALVLVSGSLAVATGIPLGVLLSRPRFRRFAETAMQGLNVGTTIPTLAVLALAMTVLGLGFAPSIFGLWLATLLPITRNTYAGLLAVPAPLKEAAVGMGMSARRMLFQVELPNALFVIFAGIRTALAINVGTVPLVFLIGGGGLGDLIFTGIDVNEPMMMLAGAIPTALLAVITDFTLSQAQRWLVPRGVNPLR